MSRLRHAKWSLLRLLPLLLLLLLLQQLPQSGAHQCRGSLYDPYCLDGGDEATAKEAPAAPRSGAESERAAAPAAYRTYYLILVRNLSLVLDSLSLHAVSGDPLPLAVNSWTVDGDAVRQLRATADLGARPSVEELQDANSLLLSLFAKLRPPPVGHRQAGLAGYGLWRWWPWSDVGDLAAPLTAAMVAGVLGWLLLRRAKLWQLLAVAAVASVAFNWVRLYRTALAQRQHAVATLECPAANQALGFWKSLGMWLSGPFRVTPVKDDCQKRLEAMVVNPLWDVSPLEAVADLLSNVVLNRFVQAMRAVNLGYRSLIEGLPFFQALFLSFMMAGLLVLALLIKSGYNFRLLFGALHLGPDHGANRHLANENRRLLDENGRLHAAAAAIAEAPRAPTLSRAVSFAADAAGGRGGGGGVVAAPRRLRASRSESNITAAGRDS